MQARNILHAVSFCAEFFGCGKGSWNEAWEVLWQWSALQRLLGYSWLRKLFSAGRCSERHGHVAFHAKQAAPRHSCAAVLCCTASLLYIPFLTHANSFSTQLYYNPRITAAWPPVLSPGFPLQSFVELFVSLSSSHSSSVALIEPQNHLIGRHL